MELARENALRARVEKFMEFKQGNFLQSSPPAEQGLLVANLPYGERIDSRESIEEFYKLVGSTLKHNYAGWTAALLVNENSPWAQLGLKPKRKIELLNGSIKTKLLIFELYSGSKRKKQSS